MFYRWQKEFFENGAAAFQSKQRPAVQVEEKQKRIEFLEKKVQTKDEVLAELMAEHIALKKVLGSFDEGVGSVAFGVGDRQFRTIVIAIPGVIVIRIPGDGDHRFRGDRDQVDRDFRNGESR